MWAPDGEDNLIAAPNQLRGRGATRGAPANDQNVGFGRNRHLLPLAP